MFELIILDGPQAGRRLTVGATPAIIGRNPAVDLPFPQDNFISGRHVSIQADGRGVLVNDLRSTNGTFINGERIGAAVAGVGDIIKIGSMNVRVEEGYGLPSAQPEAPLAAWGSALSTEPFPPSSSPTVFAPPTPAAPSPAFALPPMEIPAPPVAPVSPAAAPPVATVPFTIQPFPEPAPYSEPVPLPPPPSPLEYSSPESIASEDSGSTKILSALDFRAPPPAPSPSARALADARKKNDAVLEVLRETPGPLFCLLNAGADETIPAMLAMADVNLAEHCLLEGEAAGPPPRWAPYLLPLSPDAPLLRPLVDRGWGKGWGNFFTSFATFEELRVHFRKFLMVQVANGAEPYFRFYEPTVLREFLTAGSPAELTMFFGPVDEWTLESDNKAAVLKARNGIDGLSTTTVPLP